MVRYRAFSTFLLVSGILFWIRAVQFVPKAALAPQYPQGLPMWAIFLICYVASLARFRISIGRYAVGKIMSLAELPLALALFLEPPLQFLPMFIAAYALAAWTDRGIRLSQDYCYAASNLWYVGTAYVVFHAVGATPSDPLGVHGMMAVTAALIVSGLVSAILCRIVGLVLHGVIHITEELKSMVVDNIMVATTTGLSLAVLYLIFTRPTPIALFPAIALVAAGVFSFDHGRRRAKRFEYLYKIGEILHSSTDVAAEAKELLIILGPMFGFEQVQLVVLPNAAAEGAVHSAEIGGEVTRQSRELSTTEFEVLAAFDATNVVMRSGESGAVALRALLRERRAKRGMAALLRGQRHIMGMLILFSVENIRRGISAQDADMLANVVGQISDALENGALANVVETITMENTQLADQALHDVLTGLGNRVLFNNRVAHALERCQRLNQPVAVLFLDLDGFKEVNDTYGHASGDTILKAVAKRILSHLRKPDTASRFGGDEFAILLEDLRDVDDAPLIASRIVAAVHEPIEMDQGGVANVTASVGVSVVEGAATIPSLEDLLNRADTAMYLAKSNGRNCHVVFDQNSANSALNQMNSDILAISPGPAQ